MDEDVSERKRAILTAGVTIDIWLRYWPSVRVCVADRKVKTYLPQRESESEGQCKCYCSVSLIDQSTERLANPIWFSVSEGRGVYVCEGRRRERERGERGEGGLQWGIII